MKTGKRTARFRTGTLLLALLVLLSVCLSAQAEQLNDPTDVTMLLAENAVETFGLTDSEGNPLKPRQASDMFGHGYPDVTGVEPDYRGVVGYVSLQTDNREISRFNTFTNMPWMLPLYQRDGDEFTEVGRIRHKTPVLVTDQVIREGLYHKYMDCLKVIRLDTQEEAWIDVIHFATVPYWRLPLEQAMKYGYCVAVYRNASRYEPMDLKGHRGALPDGTRVLMCFSNPPKYFNKYDKERNPLLGIVFRSKVEGESFYRTFLFFNPDDLTLIY